jgi:hypothetical protein
LYNEFVLSNIDLNDKTDNAKSKEPVKFNLEGLSSLKYLYLIANTSEVEFSIKSLPSLTRLYLYISGTIDEYKVTRLLDQLQHIQELYFNGKLSYFNLDSLVNLRELSLSGTIDERFNFELFKNLCKQLENLKIEIKNIDENAFVNLFGDYNS